MPKVTFHIVSHGCSSLAAGSACSPNLKQEAVCYVFKFVSRRIVGDHPIVTIRLLLSPLPDLGSRPTKTVIAAESLISPVSVPVLRAHREAILTVTLSWITAVPACRTRSYLI